MTDADPTVTTDDDATPSSGDAATPSRSRSRNRTRGRGATSTASDGASTSTAEDTAGDPGSGDDGSAEGEGDGRRRRGRRGRGRGRTASADESAPSTSETTAADADGGSAPKGRERRGETTSVTSTTESPTTEVPATDASAADAAIDDTKKKSPAKKRTAKKAAPKKPASSDSPADDKAEATPDETAELVDAPVDGAGDAAAAPAKKSSTRSRGTRSSAKSGADSTAKDASAKDASAKDATGDDKVAEAIRTGGTRMAAKQSRRSGGRQGGSGGGAGGRRGRPQGITDEERRALLDGPPRTMLVTSNDERTQIAVLEDRTVVEQYVTRKKDVTFVGNIYMGRVQNVLPGMEAAFIDIGKGRNGVLYAGEVLYDELDLEEGDAPRIEDALKPGQKVLVQVTKDPMGTKGPRLTMQLSLAGRYMVLSPNSDVFGISRKLTDKDRDRLRRIVKSLKPGEHGIIVRTAAGEGTDEALEADLQRLLDKWKKVEEKATGAKALDVCYEEPQLVVKVIRDNFGPEYVACIIDDASLHSEVTTYLEEVAPELLDKVHLYEAAPVVDDRDKPESLFDAYHVTDQLRKAMDRKVNLPSGGYLIIERTEAMKVIDVNTGRYTGDKGSNLEQVVLKTNLEAAEEIVRQMRLRDLGGMIIVDFIDMLLKANQDQVVRKLKRELLRDRTKTRVSDVSKLGLVQMTRKNVSAGLVEAFSSKCETCDGRGYCIHDDRIG